MNAMEKVKQIETEHASGHTMEFGNCDTCWLIQHVKELQGTLHSVLGTIEQIRAANESILKIIGGS